MKRAFRQLGVALILIICCAMALAGCGCKHEWEDANCLQPKTCSLCELTDGESLGHTWQEATCTAAKTCTVCQLTEGESMGHTWQDATCTAARTCGACGETEGDPLEHKWEDDVCEVFPKCTLCGAESETYVEHDWVPATYESAQLCRRCFATEGEPLKPVDGTYFEMTIDEFTVAYKDELFRQYPYAFHDLMIDLAGLPPLTGGAAEEKPYSETYSLFGSYFKLTCYAEERSERINRISFFLPDDITQEEHAEISERINDYIAYGLIAYSVINPDVDVMKAVQLFNQTELQTKDNAKEVKFDVDGVVCQFTLGYHMVNIEIYIEE